MIREWFGFKRRAAETIEKAREQAEQSAEKAKRSREELARRMEEEFGKAIGGKHATGD